MDPSDIQKLAKLARLEINAETVDETAKSITDVLKLVDQLQSANTDDALPMAHPLDAVQTLRDDVITETDQRAKNQVCAPSVESGLYLVPKVID